MSSSNRLDDNASLLKDIPVPELPGRVAREVLELIVKLFHVAPSSFVLIMWRKLPLRNKVATLLTKAAKK